MACFAIPKIGQRLPNARGGRWPMCIRDATPPIKKRPSTCRGLIVWVQDNPDSSRTHARPTAALPGCLAWTPPPRSLGRMSAGAPCPCVCAGQAKGLQHPPPRSGKFWGIGGKTARPPPRVIFSPRKTTGRHGKTEGLPECEATPAPVDARRRAGVHTRSRGGGRKNLNQEMIA